MKTTKFFKTFLFMFFAILLFGAGLPLIAQAPTATTGGASSIGTDTAVLAGTVNANGSSTTVWFEYCTDNSSWDFTMPATPSPVTGSSDTPVTTTLYELTQDTTYYYRVVAQNASGTTYGTSQTFDTILPPPQVVTQAATSISGTDATLNCFAVLNGYDITIYYEYGLTTAYGQTTTPSGPYTSPPFTTVSLPQPVSGLTPNSTYHFRAVLTYDPGSGTQTVYGGDMTFNIGSVGSAPTVTTGASSNITASSADVAGTVDANQNDAVVNFEYGLDTNYGSTTLANESPVTGDTSTPVNATLPDLLPNTTYHYRVTATNAQGTTDGADRTFTTLPMAPTVTTDAASSITTTSARLNGTVNANGGSTTVTFQYGLDTGYGSTASGGTVTGTTDTAVNANISGLTNGVTYHYRVMATNSGGTTYGADMTFTAGAAVPTATTNAASGIGGTTATLNGTVNANNASTTVTFEIGTDTSYGRSINASPGTVTGSTNTAVNATPTDLVPSTTYHYRVVATNANGTTYGADMTFITTGVPTAVTNAVSGLSISGATLNGTVTANNQSTTVTFEYGTTTAYGTTVTADQSPVTGTTPTAVSKAVTGLANNTTYHYRVVATNASGTTYGVDMTFSTTISAPAATTDAATLILSDGATLNATVNANNADTTVSFEYGETVAYGSTANFPTTVTGGADTPVSLAITGLNLGTTYNYRVVATNANGTTPGANMTFTTVATPSAVTGEATDITATTAVLHCTANANNRPTVPVGFAYGETVGYGSYGYSSETMYGGNTPVAHTVTITGLTPNTTYHYIAFAMDGSPGPLYYGVDMTFTTTLAPTAVTNAATSVGSTTATFNGTVNAGDAAAAVIFEYGPDTNYGTQLNAVPGTVTGTSDTPVSLNVSGLFPNSTYHYRVTITNANGSAQGADQQFTTGGIAPIAQTHAATAITNTGAQLNGAVNPNNESTNVSFEYGLTTAYGSSVNADTTPINASGLTAVTATLSGLTPNTTYHFRVVGQNANGTGYGTDMTFYTGSSAPTVTTGAADAVTATSATLHGTVIANNNDTTVTFEYGETASYGRAATASPSLVTGSTSTAVTAVLTGLTPGITYHYRVVGQNSQGTTNGTDMTFVTNSPGTAVVTTAVATNIGNTTAVSGGEVTDEGGNPVTARGVCYGTVTAPTIAGSRTVNGSGLGVFTSNISGLSEATVYYYRAYATNANGTVYGDEYQFTTDSSTVTVSITNPDQGETVSGTVTISATASTTAGSISRVRFYVDGELIASDTTSPYDAQWDSTTVDNGSHTIRAVATNSGSTSSEDEVTVDVSNDADPPVIAVDRDFLNFGAVAGNGSTTPPQELMISNNGGGTLNWSAGFTSDWLSVSPSTGTAPSDVSISVNASGLAAGTYTDTVTFTNNGVVGDSATVDITLTVHGQGTTNVPFGSFDLPVHNSTVRGSIPVTGWALDDIEVTNVKIYRNTVPGETGSMLYIGDAVFVEGARPDVEALYPSYPYSSRAGWGYMLLTYGLPYGGNGTFTIYAEATDYEGNTVSLGSKTIIADNNTNVKPFGAIDTPAQGGTASGESYVNFGWALTPQPNTIPYDGSTIQVWVDGVPVGNPVYNQYRADIATIFPGYNNSNGAVGYFHIDTTAYANGVHTISWSVQDDAGNKDGIGSRFFSINNSGRSGTNARVPYNPAAMPEINTPVIVIDDLAPIQFQVFNEFKSIKAFQLVNGKKRKLPVGSTLDKETGRFYWGPGAGFIGTYRLLFIMEDKHGNMTNKIVDIVVNLE